MDILLLIARLILAGVLVVAGVSKLLDLAGSRQAMEGFGVPTRFAPVAGAALPIAELVLGIGLIPVSTAWWAAVGAFVLMLTFVAAIGYNLAKGRTPDCHCFGQIHSAPAGPRTLIRNGVLAGIAASVVVFGRGDPGTSIGGWLGDLSAFEITVLVAGLLAFAAIAVLGWLVVNLMTQAGRLLARLEAIEQSIETGSTVPAKVQGASASIVGTPAPAFVLPDLGGTRISLDELQTPGVPLLLLFTDPGCAPCSRLMADVPGWQRSAAGKLQIVLISRGLVAANVEKARELGLDRILLQDDREVSRAYGAPGTPAGVLVLPNGTFGSSMAGGINATRALVEEQLAAVTKERTSSNAPATHPAVPVGVSATLSATLHVGDVVPGISLPTLDGGNALLDERVDGEQVVLFWSSGCGYCRRMEPEIRQWEAARSAEMLRLTIVSTSSAEDTRQHGFGSTILLDHGVGVSGRFGARGTPAAVRIDATGHVASQVVHGAAAVLELLGGPSVPGVPASVQAGSASNDHEPTR